MINLIFPKDLSEFSKQQGSQNSSFVSNEHISNDKYLKLYRIKSNLVDYDTDTLKNSLEFK